MAQPQLAPDIEIARKAKLLPIEKVAAKLGIKEESLYHYGKTMAKIGLDQLPARKENATGKLILVTAISPTPAGEGKTTTTIGLGDALNRIGKKTSICLREPSLGPCFGVKGGATGGGMSQVAPMDDINLHFTGDFHAIGAAHNLLSAMIDNHLHHGNLLNIDPRRITWRRVLDMNDRALRQVIVGLGGAQNSVPRESGFDITVASEVMAIFCLSQSMEELKKRLGDIVIGYTYAKEPVRARDLKADGAMTVLLKQAINPNLVQTLENNPAFIHGGPFANIAHGCNSIIATKLALSLSDYVVTEAGFGADLGAEKFMDIKCRKAGIKPEAVVLVSTIRALKYHGGVEVKDVKTPNAAAVAKGMENLEHHVSIIRQFGVPVVVAINSFVSDTKEEIDQILTRCKSLGVKAVFSDHWARGGMGAEDLAHAVVETVEKGENHFAVLYPDSLSLLEKAETVAKKVYGASGIQADKSIRDKFAAFEKAGYGHFPVCIAKTQYSLSSDPKLRCRPKDFVIPIQEVRLSAGAGFVVVLTGGIMTMPGLPKVPAAELLDVNSANEIVGLF